MRIVFMGTPEFAVATLETLFEAGYEIVGVVTAPDRPAGRGNRLKASAVKEFAEEKGLPIFQPVKLRDPNFVNAMENLRPDLMVVVAFRMLPELIWSIPKIGTFNLHASLLPDYRGAAPINWVLINGETRTGATTFFIDKQIDTGKLLLQRELEIPFGWNAGDLHDELMKIGAGLVLDTVKGIESGTLQAFPQDDSLFLHPAPKIFKEDCRIDWRQSAPKVYHFIRGLSPYPTAWTELEGSSVKIFAAELGNWLEDDPEPGTIRVDKDGLYVACADRWLQILSLQIPGKKRMETADFLRGHKGELTQFS
ncbi:MAG: methionyl-tRNA formyltransferase [Bacteroidota bacterium]